MKSEALDKGTEDRIAKIAARDKARQAAGGKAPKPAASLQGQNPDELDKDPSLKKDVEKVTKNVKPAKSSDAEKAAAAHGDK